MIYAITFIYIILKAAYDCFRINKNWGGKDITHYWIDIITGLVWLVWLIWGGASFLDVSLFYVVYSLGFSPILNLFRVIFLGHVLGHSWDSDDAIWGYVYVDFCKNMRTFIKLEYETFDPIPLVDASYSKALAILCYRGKGWPDRLHEIILPGSDLRTRWAIELSLLIILIYLRL